MVAHVEQESLAEIAIGTGFRCTPHGLDVIGQPTFEQCEALWETLKTLEKTLIFAIGDALIYFEQRWGKDSPEYNQIVDASGLTFATCRAYHWLAESVPQATRRLDVLSPTHHLAVAKLAGPTQAQWLAKAVEGDAGVPWSVNRLKAAIKAGGDQVVTAWYVLVKGKDEADRDALRQELERRGYVCKATEKRGGDA